MIFFNVAAWHSYKWQKNRAGFSSLCLSSTLVESGAAAE